jgi:tetratricopeptide (TPR) repeat protein
MKHTLTLLVLALSCLLTGCTARPALSLRPLYKADEKPVAEPRLEGEWTPVRLGGFGMNEEKNDHWAITAQSDGCYRGEWRKKDPEKPDKEWNEIYRVCLVSMDNKLFFDQQLEKTRVENNMISAKDLTPELAALHMTGRLWPQQDLIRVTRLTGDWVSHNQPEDLRFDVDKFTLFSGSTAQLREIMTQHGEDPHAMESAWYLCRPNANCDVRVAEDELARQPDDKDVLSAAAFVYAGAEDYDKAIALLDKAAKLADSDKASEARTSLGLARLLKRDFSGARGEFTAGEKQAATPEDREGDAAFIGISYFLEGKYSEAHTAFAGIKDPSDDSQPMLMILTYASLVRMGRGKQAEAFLSEQMAHFKGKADQQLLLLRASGRVNDFSPGNFTDDQLLQGDGVLYALVRLAKGDRDSARQALESTVSKTPKWDPAYLGAKIELERMGSSGAKPGGK